MSRWVATCALVATLPFLITSGCASESSVGDTSGTTNADLQKPGYTACGSLVCQPGTYCSDPGAENCATGCVSVSNCSTGETCDQSNNTGICKGGSAPASTCDSVCGKLAACEVQITGGQCAQVCPTETATCTSCVLSTECAQIMSCGAACHF